jgi:hypothetical protein
MMIDRRAVLAAWVAGCVAVCLSVLSPGSAGAAEPTPQAFLESLYAPYKASSERSKGVPLDSDAAVRRYFEPQIAALMIKDFAAAKRRGEVPALDGDPFIDGQDWEVEQLAIAVKEQGPDKASGTVSFKNFGAPTSVTLDLVKGKDGWRIADIKWPERRSLRGLYPRR